jgi:hypothetical protein
MFILKHVPFFQIDNIAIFHTCGFHHGLLLFENKLIELYLGNYATLYGLVNGVDDIFQDYTLFFLDH